MKKLLIGVICLNLSLSGMESRMGYQRLPTNDKQESFCSALAKMMVGVFCIKGALSMDALDDDGECAPPPTYYTYPPTFSNQD